jgi:hypothetical protein
MRQIEQQLGSAYLKQAATVGGMSASSPFYLFRGHFSSVKMPERTDSELSQLARQHLKSHGADWEILEPFINRVLRPWESSQVLLCALCF